VADAIALTNPGRPTALIEEWLGRLGWPLAVGAVLLLQAALILHHQPFVDEWQALQIAVQSPDFSSLIANLHYEGHPPLWYLLLRAMSDVVGPHNALAATSLGLALTTQCLLLFRSPFPRWLRLVIALSEPILFEYGTVSRSYTLGVMLTFWAMSAWKTRKLVWLPLVLMPGVEFFFGVISMALLLVRWGERRIWWPGLFAWAAVGLFAAWAVIPAADFIPVYKAAPNPLQNAVLLVLQLSIVAVPFQWGAHGPLWNSVPPFGPFLVLWIAFAALCWHQTRGRPLDRVAVLGFFLVLLVFYAFYELGNRHLMLLGLLLIALQWRRSLHGDEIRRPFLAWLIVGALCGLVTAAIGLTMPFDTADRAARKIRELDLVDKHWVAASAQHGQGISAMSGILFQGVGQQCLSDFIRWNFPRTIDDADKLGAWSLDETRRYGRFYLVSEVALPRAVPAVELAHIPPGYDGKAYFLYEVGPNRPDDPRKLPRCVPGMRPFPPKT
jgi:hypothetical protein